MTVYYWILSITVILTFACSLPERVCLRVGGGRSERLISIQSCGLILVFVALIVVSGIREASVGADTHNYVVRYEAFGKCNWRELFAMADYYSFEYGFAVLCKLLYLISDDYRFFLIITSLLTGAFTLAAIKKYSKFPMLSALVFLCWGFWGSSMNILRQMMVIPLIYLALESAQKKHFVKYVLLIVLAGLLHEFSYIFLLMYPVVRWQANKTLFIIAAVLALFFGLGGYRLLGILLRNTSFGWYFDKPKSTSGLSTLILITLITLLCLAFKGDIKKIDDNIDLWIIMLLAAMVSTAIGMNVSIFERLTRCFVFPFLFVFPDLYLVFKQKGVGKVALPVLVILLLYYYLFVIMITPEASSRIIPYETWIGS